MPLTNSTSATPQTPWLTPAQVMAFEGVSRREVYRRMQPGDPCLLLSKAQDDGRSGRLIHPRSMSPAAQERWRQDVLRNAVKPDAEPAQPGLLPTAPIDTQIAALTLSRSERDVVLRRYRIVDLCLNHNFKAEGYSSLGEFETALAEREYTTKRNVQRWLQAWNQHENLLDLVPERPGPAPGTGTVLDRDARAHLIDCWVIKKLNLRQCYRSLIKYLETKQESVGCRVDHFYSIPSRTTVERFIRSLSPIDDAAREGADALKAACGYIDRTYCDAPSMGRCAVDEWKSDVLAYDPRHASRVGRYYLLTFLDERSRYPLVWSLAEVPNSEDEIDLLCRLIREFGAPGLINSDRGRFRGKTFGGQYQNRDRSEMFKERDGILDRLDIGRNTPGNEHNPRANRIERFHLELANWARTVPGWIGRDVKQRPMTDGDARAALHKQWVRTRQGKSPLLSRDQLLERLSQFMAEFRQCPSNGNDMDGFAPEAVFRQNAPVGGFRRVSDEELAWKTAEYFDVKIAMGGIVQLRDGKRYSGPELLLIQGEHREVVRHRHDHEQISVLPAAKGEQVIIAKRRVRVGVNDPDQLASAMELQNRLRKLVGGMVKPLDYDPQFLDASSKPEAPEPSQEQEISSPEWLMEHDRYKKRVKPLDFADLES